jgi:hypothetical protein
MLPVQSEQLAAAQACDRSYGNRHVEPRAVGSRHQEADLFSVHGCMLAPFHGRRLDAPGDVLAQDSLLSDAVLQRRMKCPVHVQAGLIRQALFFDGLVDFANVPITGTMCSLTIDAYRSAVRDANRSRVASIHEFRNASRLVDAACSRAIPLSTAERISRFLASASPFGILPMRTLRRLRLPLFAGSS